MVLVPDEVLDGEKWMDHLPEFKAWIASLSEKTLYKHLLESLNVAAESDEGTGLIEQLSESDLASAVDGFDAHMACDGRFRGGEPQQLRGRSGK